MKKSHPHYCEICKKTWYRLVDGQLINHNCKSMITIYTTPTCFYCKKAKAYFKSRRLEHREVSLIDNKEAQRLVMEKTGSFSVPVIEKDGKFRVGFNQSDYE